MKKQEIKIEIDMKTGAISGDVVSGPGGQGCEKMLSEILGHFDQVDVSKKPEWYQTQAIAGTVHNKK